MIVQQIPKTMRALVKASAAPGMEMREVPVPEMGATDVLVAVETASVCGTDLHIYHWDEWAQARIKPPYIPGHEFCGTVAAVGELVQGVSVGDFVSAEMHVACGHCLQCRSGQAHVCQFVKILGVDADGAFAEYARIPASNVWKLDAAIARGVIPREWGSLFDPFGNAVHTVLSGAIAGQTVAMAGGDGLGECADLQGRDGHGINGRKMYETWFQAEALIRDRGVDLSPVITHRLPLEKFDEAMHLLESGEASKILLSVRQ